MHISASSSQHLQQDMRLLQQLAGLINAGNWSFNDQQACADRGMTSKQELMLCGKHVKMKLPGEPNTPLIKEYTLNHNIKARII